MSVLKICYSCTSTHDFEAWQDPKKRNITCIISTSSYNLFNAAGEILKVRSWIWMLASTVKTWRYSLREWTRKLVDEASPRKQVFGCLFACSG